MSLNKVTVTGTYVDGEGNPCSGQVIFTPNTRLAAGADDLLVRPVPVTVTLTDDGTISAELYATDNADLEPSGWCWTAIENITYAISSTWNFFLAYSNGATQDLSDLEPIAVAAATSVYLQVSGGTMGGPLVLSGEPTAPLMAAPKEYVDAETTRAEAAEAALATSISSDVSGLAPLASPALTGSPTAPTQTTGDSSTKIATDAFVATAVATETTRAETTEALKAPLASPALTGTPTAPTAAALTDDTQVATTAYADSAVAVEKSRAQTAEALLAPLASPALTGSPTAPTQTTGDNSTKIATDAFVATAVAAETSRAETAEALKAPLASPTFTGTVTVPTPSTSSAAATKAYVDSNAIIDGVTVSGTPSTGQVLTATGPAAADWQTPDTGTVTSVTAADTSIVVGGTSAAPTVRTATLDVIATDHPPAASVPMNSQKLTGLANGSASADSAAFGQLPSSSSPLPLSQGGTGVSESTDAALLAALGAAGLASPALTGTPTAPTAAALTDSTQLATTAYTDSAVAVEKSRAQTAEALALPKAGGTMTGLLALAGTQLAWSTKTGAYTLASTDDVILGNATSAAFTLSLPTAASAGSGKVYVVSKSDSSAHTVTVAPNGSDTISGVNASSVLASQYDLLILVADGTSNWLVAGAEIAPLTWTSSPSWTVPVTGWWKLIAIGSGGGGGGGGSMSTAATAGQQGGTGGGEGKQVERSFFINAGTVLTGTVGATASGGGGGAAGSSGNIGTSGTNGNASSWSGTGVSLTAPGGGGGYRGAAATASNNTNTGAYACASTTAITAEGHYLPGLGEGSLTGGNYPAGAPIGSMTAGPGSGGAVATASVGGIAGSPGTQGAGGVVAGGSGSGSATGATASAAGATAYGAGGGGGGGGATTGAGGGGGAGGPGLLAAQFISV